MTLPESQVVPNQAVADSKYPLTDLNGSDAIISVVTINTPQNVHGMVKWALKVGWLHKSPCLFCKSTKVVGHHQDYSKPFDVVWVCRSHHQQLHADMRANGGGPRNIDLNKNCKNSKYYSPPQRRFQ